MGLRGAAQRHRRDSLCAFFAIPILFCFGLQNVRRIAQYRTMDIGIRSQVLSLLTSDECQIDLARIIAEVPGVDEDLLLAEALEVPGVVFLKREPEGMVLTDRLREELQSLRD